MKVGERLAVGGCSGHGFSKRNREGVSSKGCQACAEIEFLEVGWVDLLGSRDRTSYCG